MYKIKIKNELAIFAMKFSLLVSILLVVFYFIFPYYRILLRYVASGFFSFLGSGAQYPENILLDFMPYVSLSALVLATPRKALKEKIKFILPVLALFFFVDVVFLMLQVLISTHSSEILLLQELLVISLPIVLWWSFAHETFKY